MSYTINLTNGSIFATIPDGTINSDSSLILVGRNYNGYGEFVAENFMRLLENHANGTAPAAPLPGQMWYDSTAAILKVYNGTTFKNLGTATSQSSEPVTPVTGDLWYDTASAQLKMYNGATYTLIGPLYSTSTGTAGPIVETIQDTGATDHVVTITYSENAVIAIFSKDAEFTPDIPISGFATIKPGIQLSTDIAGEFPQFVGTATNAELLDNLNSTQFLRSDQNDTTTGTLGILTDTGVTIGADSDLRFSVTGSTAYITNDTTDGQLIIQANPQGTPTDVITVAMSGANARARVSAPLNGLDITNKTYVDDADTLLSDSKLSRDGSQTMTGHLIMASGTQVQLEDGNHRITHNDGGGNFNIRVGNEYDAGTKYTATDSGAVHLVANTEGVLPNLVIKLGNTSTTTIGNPVTFSSSFTFGNDGNLSVSAATPSLTSDLTRKDYVDLKAPIDSPALTGTPTSTTPLTSDNSTRIATTAFVQSQVDEAEHFVYPTDYTGSRSLYTVYTNTTGYNMFVAVMFTNTNDYRANVECTISLGGYPTVTVPFMSWTGNGDTKPAGFWVIPPGAQYTVKISDSSSKTIVSWYEYR